MRPFHLVEHGRVVMVGVVLVRTALVEGFGTDLPVVVDDHLPVADLPLPAANQRKFFLAYPCLMKDRIE